jgi:hypothetical protein
VDVHASARVTLAMLLVALPGCGGDGREADEATIRLAKSAYTKALFNGVDLRRGPCLGVIKKDWVADVVHEPRKDIDDKPANQCAAYRDGRAHHFVELNRHGDYVRSG